MGIDMGENKITTYEELDKIWSREYSHAVSLDVFFIKKAWWCIDGIAVLMSPNVTYYMIENIYRIRIEDYDLWNEDDKKYFEREFGL